jgi:hypothetical protein
MSNNGSISSKLSEVINSNDKKFDTDSFKSLSTANEKYNNLLKTGTIKKRGYTLRGIEDTHLLHFRINHI